MSSRTLSRKQFLVFSAASAALAGFLQACGSSDSPPATSTGGSGGTGTSTGGGGAGGKTGGGGGTGGGTAGTASASGGTSGSTSLAGSSGSGGASGGAGGGSGAASGGSGGAAGGSGGASGGAGGGSGGSGGGSAGTSGGGGGMCGTASITHTAANPASVAHTHIPTDATMLTMLKSDLKALINGTMSTMAFTVPKDGLTPGHTHTFTLSAAQVTTLKGGGMVTGITTATDSTGHTHTYTIACAN